MILHPFAVFETHEDYVSWDKYEQQNDLIEELTGGERQSAKTGMHYLRGLLGEDFLHRAVEEGNPLFSFFANAAPRARRSLIRMVEELKSFENAGGFKGLVARLKNARKAPEALTVLGAASSFSRVGFIVSFDPEVTGSRKIPDLLIIDPDNREEIYVEVSRLRRGGLQEWNNYIYNLICDEVHHAIWACGDAHDLTKPHVLTRVRVLRSISRKELPGVIERIRRAIFETGSSNEYRTLQIGDAVEMAVSPAHDHSQAKAWGAERGMRYSVESPPISLERELRKARAKIVSELDQLPANNAGVIVMPTNENLLFVAYPEEEIIMEIVEELRQHSNLLCAALHHSCFDGEREQSVAALGHHAFVTTLTNLSTDRTAFVMNESFALPLAASTVERVRNAFLTI
jgi:hypothetical protein